MIVRMLRVVTAGVLLLLAGGALAQQTNPKPWYAAVGAGGAWNSDRTLSGGGVSATVSTKTGLTANGAFGRYLDDLRVLRVEVETLYDRSDVSNINGAHASGDVSNVGLMFNFLYDIHTDSSWIPYLGGGIGYSWVSYNDISQNGVTALDDSNSAFSWQFKGGIAYQFNPSMAITLGYRFYQTNNLSFNDPSGLSVKTGGTKIQNAELGFRFHF